MVWVARISPTGCAGEVDRQRGKLAGSPPVGWQRVYLSFGVAGDAFLSLPLGWLAMDELTIVHASTDRRDGCFLPVAIPAPLIESAW